MDTLNISIPSIPENIRIIESFIDNAKEKFNLSDDMYGNIMVAVTESVTNAIHHGNKKDAKKLVFLTLKFDTNRLTCIIEDQGKGFDYHDLPDPTQEERIDKPCGRGIFLMKHLCDEVSFKDEGRKVIMVFYLS